MKNLRLKIVMEIARFLRVPVQVHQSWFSSKADAERTRRKERELAIECGEHRQ
ncbi:hypothetical protein [Qipengyuania atrilutea]|uniref:Uncharacterized protein n=1 Tax=Qipengyuania atrilutea TaxID=2744473 RepID=A0A850H8I6_9SPHN|nr:hypothetical protein [Actirhodobacter atriluteus]NVD46158.1 hypothetical protein [Actirhodobacter atriluteus]